ncbi:MAG: 4Fe-4S dicluster domain-containing protein [Syntrophomonadaceae bacterium]|jgi:ferredoxin like protein|nr:4Fe-4S dicluster domain-containing protein [Syntrophomonadaceae bacterium]
MEVDEIMNADANLKSKLGLNVFKRDKDPHIVIKEGCAKDGRLKKALLVCPAGLYTENADGEVELTMDGCLECGTCLIACGAEVLEWNYPSGGAGVQYRFG